MSSTEAKRGPEALQWALRALLFQRRRVLTPRLPEERYPTLEVSPAPKLQVSPAPTLQVSLAPTLEVHVSPLPPISRIEEEEIEGEEVALSWKCQKSIRADEGRVAAV